MKQAAFAELYGGPVAVETTPPAPKHVQATSAALYAYLEGSGALATTRRAVYLAVHTWHQGDAQHRWPTACELQRAMAAAGTIPNDGNPNHVKPRLSELADGWDVTRVEMVHGRRVRTKGHVACHVLVRGAKRKSDVSGITCLTWQVR